MSIRVAVHGVGLFTPTAPNVAAWAGRSAEGEASPTGEFIERRSRRRVSTLTKALADAYAEAVEQSGVSAETAPAVFGSALGEASTMISLLDQMWREGEGLSPMKFAMSVHNAAAGVVSISGKNTGFTTSLGADFDTPAMSLMEAIGLVATRDEPVVVVCGDDAVPIDIVPEDKAWTLLTAAIVIGPPSDAAIAHLSGLAIQPGEVPATPVSGPLERNPNVGLLDLVLAVAQGTTGRVSLDRGAGRGWSVQVESSR